MKKSMMILKRIAVMAIVAASLFSLAACSKGDDSQDQEGRYVFSENFSLAENRGIPYNSMYSLNDDKLYFVTQGEYDDSLGMYNSYVNMCDLSDGNVTELFLIKPDNDKPADADGYVSAEVEAIKAEDNGDITAIVYSSINDGMGSTISQNLKKYTYSTEGEKKGVCEMDLTGLDEGADSSVTTCRIDRQGQVYVLFHEYEGTEKRELYQFNSDGLPVKKFDLGVLRQPANDILMINDIILDSNDRPVVIYEEEQTDSVYTVAAYIDMDKGAMGDKLEGIVNGEDNISRMFSVYSGGSDSTFLVNDKINLSEYDDSTGTESVICNWMDCGLSGAYVIYAVKCENGNIFCLYNDGYTQGDSDNVIAGFIEKTDISDDRPVIRVAGCGSADGLQQDIIKMNRENEKYRVELVSYAQYDNSAERFKYDIMAGNVPDVILLDAYIDIYNFIAQEFLEDLSPYIKNDDVLNEDYFLDGFLDAIKVDGKNYFLSDGFTIYALVGKKSDLAGYEDGWTVDDFIEYYRSKPEGTNVLPNTTKQGMCFTLLGQNMNKFMDWDTGKCTFDGEEFKKLLEFCNGFENGDIFMDGEYEMQDHIKAIKKGRLLFEKAVIGELPYMQIFKTLFDNDEMYVGYPSDNDSGIYISCGGMGIFASSEHKEEAWDFIKTMFTDVTDDENSDEGLSSSKRGFERHFAKASSSFEGNHIFNGISISPSEKEDADLVKELLKKATYKYYSFEYYEIIQGELDSYFAGEKGLDQTVEIIQDKMDKYVNENR